MWILIDSNILTHFSAALSVLAISSHANVILKEAEPQKLMTVRCEAYRVLDKVILEAENLSGSDLKRYLDRKCAHLGVITAECKVLVHYTEQYGHRLSAYKLCHNLVHAS
ncbi:hypothetical protein L596_023629 [Steinernema carpocapsae]|uniref:PIN domain-containing protein n=1 Tax=Steinernema carpocapsae TaxID=34508 RepID=A0A4U5ME77_STECR|nr:hypothetical protein L596_023629 [Steinernema carpocapsae]